MTREEAIKTMIKKVEEIERQHLSNSFTTETTQIKKECVEQIYKALKGLSIENENNEN